MEVNDKETHMRPGRVVLATIGVVALIVGLAIGGWKLGWWMKSETVSRNAQIFQDSYGRQTAIVDSIVDDITEATDPDIPEAQRLAIVDQICDNAAHLDDTTRLPRNARTFIAQECPA